MEQNQRTARAQRVEEQAARLAEAIKQADAVVVGAGAGLSTAAGFTYAGERFERLFSDFARVYGFSDMYTGGFYPYATLEEHWGYWSRYIWCNRYELPPKNTYAKLKKLLDGKDSFVITTNVDHLFQRYGFDKKRLFYTQGDYGLWQCGTPCHAETYDNYETVRLMVEQQRDRKVPAALVPRCPRCGEPLTMNLRADDTFVEDAGWHEAQARYHDFLNRHASGRVLYLELGVGGNTPVIIKYPFWRMTEKNKDAIYACVNLGQAYTYRPIEKRSIVIGGDIDAVLDSVLAQRKGGR